MRVITFLLTSLTVFCYFASNSFAIQHSVYEEWNISVHSIYDTLEFEEFESARQFRNTAYSELINVFIEQYIITGETHYLVFALNESGSSRRAQIVHDLNLSNDFIVTNHHLNRIINREFHPDLLKVRPFTPSDFYLFQFFAPPTQLNPATLELLKYWENEIPALLRSNPTKAHFSLLTIIYGYNRLNRFDDIVRVSRFLENDLFVASSHFALTALKHTAFALIQNGFYNRSLNLYTNHIIPISEALGDKEEYHTARVDYANILFRLGRYRQALGEYEQVYYSDYQIESQRHITALLNNLAVSYLNVGDFTSYLAFQLNAYEDALKANDLQFQLLFLRNLFVFHLRQNEPAVALAYLKEAEELALVNDLTSELSAIYSSQALYLRDTKNSYDEAIKNYKLSANFARQAGSFIDEQTALFGLSTTYELSGNIVEAKIALENIIEASIERNDIPSLHSALIWLARLELLEGNYENAYGIMSEISDSDILALRFQNQIKARTIQAQLLEYNKNNSDALLKSKTILNEITNWLSESADPQTGQMQYDREIEESIQILTSILYRNGFISEATEWFERLRLVSRTAFFNSPLLKATLLTNEELEVDVQIGNEIERLRGRLQNLEETSRIDIINRIIQLQNKRNSLLGNKVLNFDNQQASTIHAIQRSLRRSEAIFFINVVYGQVYSVFITRRNIDFIKHTDSESLLLNTENAANSLRSGNTNLNYLRKVYLSLFDGRIPKGITDLFIVPDDVFYRIPFETLPVTEPASSFSYGRTSYMIENYRFGYYNALSDITNKNSRSQNLTHDYAGFGISDFSSSANPSLSFLPLATKEIEEAYTNLTSFSKKVVFTENSGTATNFLDVAGNSSILHLATHSEVSSTNALFSKIIFHPSIDEHGNKQDGIINAYNLFELNLNNDLIIMNSCDSGTGDYIPGSGILGFSRAFKYAGAKSLMMNLWPVTDKSASTLTTNFLENINNGTSKSEALQDAQVHYINYINSNPAQWGSLIIFGDTSPLTGQRNPFLLLLIILTALIFTIMIIYKINPNYSRKDEI